MKLTVFAWTCLFALMSGCASTQSLSDRMADWQGQPVGAAVEAWGQPESERTFGDETVLIWRDRAFHLMPTGFTSDLDTAAVICERMLAVSGSGTITGWRWRGDACLRLHDTSAPGNVTLSHNAL